MSLHWLSISRVVYIWMRLQTLSRNSSCIDTDLVEIPDPEIEFDNAAHCANLPAPSDVKTRKQKRLMRRGLARRQAIERFAASPNGSGADRDANSLRGEYWDVETSFTWDEDLARICGRPTTSLRA